MRSLTPVVAGLLLAAACSDGTSASPTVVVSSRLLAPAVDSGGTAVIRVQATNVGSREVSARAGSTCVARARLETPAGVVVPTPILICAPVITTYHFAPGDTSQWDVNLEVRTPPGPYVVVASLEIGKAITHQDTLPLVVQ